MHTLSNEIEVYPPEVVEDVVEWEYKTLRLRVWHTDTRWINLAGDERYLEPLAQDYFWRVAGESVCSELRQWHKQGWEPLEPVGPQAIEVACLESIDQYIDPPDLLLWVLTPAPPLLLQSH